MNQRFNDLIIIFICSFSCCLLILLILLGIKSDKTGPDGIHEYVVCSATGKVVAEGNTTKEGVQIVDSSALWHDLKTGWGVIVYNGTCVVHVPPDKVPDLVKNGATL